MRKVVLPLIETERSLLALQYVKKHFSHTQAEIIIVMADESLPISATREDEENALATLETKLQLISGVLKRYQVITKACLGKAGQSIVKVAKEYNADYIVMTKSAQPDMLSMIGKTTEYVINNAACNVLIVSENKASSGEYKGLIYKKAQAVVNLRGQIGDKQSECLLPSVDADCNYHFDVTVGKIRFFHTTYNPETGNWDLPPSADQIASVDVAAGETADILVKANSVEGKADRIRIINRGMKQEAVFTYKITAAPEREPEPMDLPEAPGAMPAPAVISLDAIVEEESVEVIEATAPVAETTAEVAIEAPVAENVTEAPVTETAAEVTIGETVVEAVEETVASAEMIEEATEHFDFDFSAIEEQIAKAAEEKAAVEESEEAIDESVEEVAEEAVEEVIEEAAEETIEEVVEASVEEAAEDVIEESIEAVAEDMVEDVAEDVVEETIEETADDVAELITEEMTEDAAEDTVELISEDTADVEDIETIEKMMIEETSEEIAEEAFEEIAEETSDIEVAATEDAIEETTEDTFEEAPAPGTLMAAIFATEPADVADNETAVEPIPEPVYYEPATDDVDALFNSLFEAMPEPEPIEEVPVETLQNDFDELINQFRTGQMNYVEEYPVDLDDFI